MLRVKSLLRILKWKRKCDHRFRPIDIMNKKSEPKCVYCNKTLTELSKN